MQFLVIGRDGKDKNAPKRRLTVRQEHINLGEELRLTGNMWYGAVLLGKDDSMVGSILMMDFPNRKELDKWLKNLM